ncbi:MAG: TetR family transcriptional regulator [Caldithrix sp.]|nr:TetR family transcriptional regulator [Caldithrix sp.]
MDMFTDRQKEIILAAIDLIAEQGIQKVTIKNLSARIHVTEAAIYRHFNSKIEILLAILKYFKINNSDIVDTTLKTQKNPLEQLQALMLSHFKLFEEKPSLASVIFAEEIFQNDNRLSEMVYTIMQGNEQLMIKTIEKGQETGIIRNDIGSERIALIIMGMLRLTITKWRLSGYEFDLVKEGIANWRAIQSLLKP